MFHKSPSVIGPSGIGLAAATSRLSARPRCGTPGMLVGPYPIPGAIDLAGLRKAVALAREDPTGASAS
jgi:hypothetical protein